MSSERKTNLAVPLDAITRDRLRTFAASTGKTEREIASELLTELLFDDALYGASFECSTLVH